MKSKGKRVIASKRNASGVRVYIPEKIRRQGVTYTQGYRFVKFDANPCPVVISESSLVTIRMAPTYHTITLMAPFSLNLLRSYLNQVVSVIGKSATGVFRVLRKPKEGYVPLPREQKPDGSQDVPVFLEPNPDPLDQGDEAYYRGQAKIDFE
jgi:hypothetical protein